MSHPLDSAYAKLIRATEHLEQAETEFRFFLKSNPYQTVIDYHFHAAKGDPDGGVEHWHEIKLRVLAEPRLGLRLVVADCLQNIRSALDHVAYELAALNPAQKRGEKTQYPIFMTEAGYKSKVDLFLQGVLPEHRARIRETQPWHPKYRLLDALRVLNDRDKHRTLETLVSRADSLQVEFEDPSLVTDFRQSPEDIYFDDGTVLAVFTSASEVKMKRTLGFRGGFGIRGGPVVGPTDLRILIGLASEIVAGFRSAFDPPHRHEGQVSHEAPPRA